MVLDCCHYDLNVSERCQYLGGLFLKQIPLDLASLAGQWESWMDEGQPGVIR